MMLASTTQVVHDLLSFAAKTVNRFLTGACLLFVLGCSSGGSGDNAVRSNVSVPDVVGQTHAAAEASIVATRLTVGTVTSQSSNTTPVDDVMIQSPPANTMVAQGSAVDLVVSSGPPTVAVPNVVGLTQAQATTDLTTAGLVPGIVTQQNDDNVPAGDVIDQDPISGTMVASGSAVDLVVSLGPATVATPNVVGLSEAQAIVDITAAGLAVGTVTRQNDDTVPAGDVVAQDPAGGTMVAPGSAVDLVVSLGPGTTAVPSVVGLSEAQAANTLLTAGLTVGVVTRQPDDTIPAGDVIIQDPDAGTMVASGSAVDLVVSEGPATIAAPNVVGLSQAQATADIVSAGLILGNVTQQNDDTVPAGDVISQDPIAGTMVASGSGIDLVVSLGPGTTAVPDVTGLTTAEAITSIVSAGLTPGAVSNEFSDTVPMGLVISQDPTGGAMVAPASTVDIVVSLGVGTTTVPDVTGMTEAEATAEIGVAGLIVGTVTLQSSGTVPSGDVISQNPSSGMTVDRGSAVDLVVSTG